MMYLIGDKHLKIYIISELIKRKTSKTMTSIQYNKVFETINDSNEAQTTETKYIIMQKALLKMNLTMDCIGSDFTLEKCEDVREQIILTIVLTFFSARVGMATRKILKHHFSISCSKIFFLKIFLYILKYIYFKLLIILFFRFNHNRNIFH